MRRIAAALLLVACAFVVAVPTGADAAKKKKPKVFKQREFNGTVVTTTPGQALSTQLQIRVQTDRCRPADGGAAKKGVCLQTSIDGGYYLNCTTDGRPVSSNETSSVIGGFRLKDDGTGNVTTTQAVRSGPGEAPQTFDEKIVWKVGKTKISGTAYFKRTSGPLANDPSVTVCEGTATFEAKLSR